MSRLKSRVVLFVSENMRNRPILVLDARVMVIDVVFASECHEEAARDKSERRPNQWEKARQSVR